LINFTTDKKTGMYKIISGIVIVFLLAGNIYFYLKSKEKTPLMADKTIKFKNGSSLTPSAGALKYAIPAYNLRDEMVKVDNNRNLLEQYAAKNKCNTKTAFIIDMRIPSYKKRFFIFDLKKDIIIDSGYVAHGTGSETFRNELIFSNVPDSRCTSLGKYKIGASYKGIYGFSYRLHGLDSTNNKALERAIVLHGHSCIPDKAYDDYPICFSYGCPMVSTQFLQTLKGFISKQGKEPILLSIIY
jgi:L,D-transpeptidase catalytic domain